MLGRIVRRIRSGCSLTLSVCVMFGHRGFDSSGVLLEMVGGGKDMWAGFFGSGVRVLSLWPCG